MRCWRRMKKIKWSENVNNKQVLERIGKKRTFLNNILRRKVNWIGHIVRRNCLFHNVIEGPDKSESINIIIFRIYTDKNH